MTTDSKLNEVENSLKEKYSGIIKDLSHVELKRFQKHEYKTKVLEDITALLPTFNKSKLDDTAQCVSNFLHSEVKDLLRRKPRDSRANNTNLLSETVINDLNSTMEPPDSETDTNQFDSEANLVDENAENDGEMTKILDDSLTHLKEAARASSSGDKTPDTDIDKSTCDGNNSSKCCNTCKVKPNSKRKYDMIRCSICAHWFHEECVGIAKDEPVGIWLCNTCKSIPTSLKHDVSDMKSEVNELKECTKNILKAVLDLSTKVERNFGTINDRITALTRQINGKDLIISESLEQLQTSTSTLKSSLDQKSCKIINQTAAVLEKVKVQSENIKTITKSNQKLHYSDSNNTAETSQTVTSKDSETAEVHINDSERKRFKKPKQKAKKSNPYTAKKNNPNSQKAQKSHPNSNTDEVEEFIDLTKNSKKHISQTTLLVGSSILKGVKTNQLNSDTAVRSFPGATTVSLREKLKNYDIESCKTVILHVGGNDADDGDSLETFCDNYIELLESLASDDRRLIVSGLLPRKSVDLEPYNDILRSLCAENDTEFIDNYQNFLLASGEIPSSYFWTDKLHLNQHGTRKLVTDIDKTCKIKRSAVPEHNRNQSKRPFMGPRRMMAPPAYRGRQQMSKFCHICQINNHSTQQCWYNGRNSGVPDRAFQSYQ